MTRGNSKATQTTATQLTRAAVVAASDETPGTTWAAGCCDLSDAAADWTADETLSSSRPLDTDTVAHLRPSVQLTCMHLIDQVSICTL